MPSKKSEFNFEQALSELTTLVERMEKGGLSLEASLKDFEQGLALAKTCEKALMEAEQKVLVLTKNEKGERLTPFTPPASHENDT